MYLEFKNTGKSFLYTEKIARRYYRHNRSNDIEVLVYSAFTYTEITEYIKDTAWASDVYWSKGKCVWKVDTMGLWEKTYKTRIDAIGALLVHLIMHKHIKL